MMCVCCLCAWILVLIFCVLCLSLLFLHTERIASHVLAQITFSCENMNDEFSNGIADSTRPCHRKLGILIRTSSTADIPQNFYLYSDWFFIFPLENPTFSKLKMRLKLFYSSNTEIYLNISSTDSVYFRREIKFYDSIMNVNTRFLILNSKN